MSQSSEPPDIAFEAISIVGVGLIGGSLGGAVKRRGLARRVIGVGRRIERLAEAQHRGLVDECCTDVGDAASRSDLIVLCTPVDRIAVGVRDAAVRARPGTLITDAGSVKQAICEALSGRLPPQVEFVGSHPLAGSEKQGCEHADATLFDGKVCVVTPSGGSRAGVEQVGRFWSALGMSVLEMSPHDHDVALAETSHLPHVVAAALAGTLQPAHTRLAASGFCDTTRVAGGDAALWSAILLANAEPVLASLDRFAASLSDLRQALRERDGTRLMDLLAEARRRRENLPFARTVPDRGTAGSPAARA